MARAACETGSEGSLAQPREAFETARRFCRLPDPKIEGALPSERRRLERLTQRTIQRSFNTFSGGMSLPGYGDDGLTDLATSQ